ncbi:outer membrane homotrimeric porin [Paucidesulfovibrio longus]|uniref:outer membrane homotrimeric porin n=1 Tax=Paucidesulfovibrio longus TaxID=889 RepID=UPI0003B6130E|nr:outer membrane homotrimeric porin [Paucidesulfovibrio longus]
MKRMIMMATLLAMLVGTASVAVAAELTATGSWYIAGIWSDGESFNDRTAESDFDVFQRLRTSFDFTANENLKGVLQIEIGTSQWGSGFAALGADQRNIEIKSAYINWVWPNTDVSITAGVLPLALPKGKAGNAVLDADVAALVVSAPLTDNVSLLAGWARPYSHLNDSDDYNTSLDILFGAVPLSFDGVSATPYFAYMYSGDKTGKSAGAAAFNNMMITNSTKFDVSGQNDVTAWWGGLTFSMTMFDPITVDASFVYGSADPSVSEGTRSGWLADLAVAYTGLDYVTPELFFTYSTGEDGNASKDADSERLPTISGDYAFGTTFFSSKGMTSDNGLQNDAANMGYWALGLNLKDISFLEGLKHTITVMYAQGTNDKDFASDAQGYTTNALCVYGRTLTEEDSLWELSLVNTYKIYPELTATLGLGYIAANFDEDVWEKDGLNNYEPEDSARLVLGIEYKF